MATRDSIVCPICHDVPSRDRNLEDHLVTVHTKQKLAKFVVAETEAQTETDISEWALARGSTRIYRAVLRE
ncbi:hypothetical protein GCM10009530_78670 [Microbispora corallina]